MPPRAFRYAWRESQLRRPLTVQQGCAMPRVTPDVLNPLAVFTTRELLANRAMLRKRRRRRGGAAPLLARIEAELERRQSAKAARLFVSVPPIPALDETSGWFARGD